MTYNQLQDIIIERTTALTKCKYQNDINQKKLLEAQALITSLTCERDELLRLIECLTDPTAEMIEAGAQRLVQWEDGCVWPDSWSALDVAAARNEAERCWRSMAQELMGPNYK